MGPTKIGQNNPPPFFFTQVPNLRGKKRRKKRRQGTIEESRESGEPTCPPAKTSFQKRKHHSATPIWNPNSESHRPSNNNNKEANKTRPRISREDVGADVLQSEDSTCAATRREGERNRDGGNEEGRRDQQRAQNKQTERKEARSKGL